MGGPDLIAGGALTEGSRLLGLRESLGFSLEGVARRACLSAKQIHQLEIGEWSAFYSLSIRQVALKRVIQMLEADVQALSLELAPHESLAEPACPEHSTL